MLFYHLLTFYKINILKMFFRNTAIIVSNRCIQIRADLLLVLISVQTVCKGYQQMTLVGKELKDFSKKLILKKISRG